MTNQRDPSVEVDIDTSAGVKPVVIRQFNAMDGWTAKYQMREYATSTDVAFRRQFTLVVLSRASVDGRQIENEEDANELLENWQNIERVFMAVLDFNNIDYFVKEDLQKHWKMAGAEIAVAFVSQMERLIGTGLEKTLDSAAEKVNG
jgi:hypothetical protein